MLVVTLPHPPRHPLSSPQTLPQLLCASLGFSPWQLNACYLDAPVVGPSGPQPHSSSHLHTCLWALSLISPPTIDHAHYSQLLCLASSERSWSPSAQHSPTQPVPLNPLLGTRWVQWALCFSQARPRCPTHSRRLHSLQEQRSGPWFPDTHSFETEGIIL